MIIPPYHPFLAQGANAGRAAGENWIEAVLAGACLDCARADARDLALTQRWLLTPNLRAHGALGVALCATHTWRAALIAVDAPGAPLHASSDLHVLLALYMKALDHLLADVRLALARLERMRRSRVARWFPRSGALMPGWLGAYPGCPLCARQASGDAGSLALAALDHLDHWAASLSAHQRTAIVAQQCGAHRTLASDAGAHRTQERAGDTQTRWWLAPGAPTPDHALLLREQNEPPFPDDLCPLCVARVEHARSLLAALSEAGATSDSVQRDDTPSTYDIHPAALCQRHTALLRASASHASHLDVAELAPEEPLTLIVWALSPGMPGTLRASGGASACPACAIIDSWELARIEGLHRAAGGAALSEPITERLIGELERTHVRFCAPHLRRLLQFGPAETTWAALGPSIERSLTAMSDNLRSVKSASAPSGCASAIYLAAAALGGLPA